jgi:hypothetical protein
VERRAAFSTLRRMALHPLAAHFAELAGVYERGRPEYAHAVVAVIAAELSLSPAIPRPSDPSTCVGLSTLAIA